MQPNENKRTAPILIGHKTHDSRAHFGAFRAHKSANARATPRLSPQLLHRVIHTIHNAPVDITVDNEGPRNDKKAQQNQHFEYHRDLRRPYGAVNKPLTSSQSLNPTLQRQPAWIVTLVWNMHRSGAACSLNVTRIGICLSRQHLRICRNRANLTPEIARTVDWTGMQDYSDLDLWNARWPTSQGFFRGFHESA